MGNQKGTSSQRTKLMDLRETITIDKALIKRYKFVSDRQNQIRIFAKYQDEIDCIEEKKAELLREIANAPQKLIDLRRHVKELQSRHKSLHDESTGKTKRIAKYKTLKARLEKLQAEMNMAEQQIDELITKGDENVSV